MASHGVVLDGEDYGQFHLIYDDFTVRDWDFDQVADSFLQSFQDFDTVLDGIVPFGNGEFPVAGGQSMNDNFDFCAIMGISPSQQGGFLGVHALNNARSPNDSTQSGMSFMLDVRPISFPDNDLGMSTLDTPCYKGGESPETILQTASQQQTPKSTESTPRTPVSQILTCPACKMEKTDTKSLKRHIMEIHEKPKSGEWKQGWYTCKCGESACHFRKSNYTRHLEKCKQKNCPSSMYRCQCGDEHVEINEYRLHISKCRIGRRSVGRPRRLRT